MKQKRINTSKNHLFFDLNQNITLDMFYNDNTINIFCDASVRNKGKTSYDICYGVVAVQKDTILDSEFRIATDSTNNEGEIKGLRSALSMAAKFVDSFQFVNIFSDSKISIIGLREYIYNWKYDPSIRGLRTRSGSIVSNQSIFIECYQMLSHIDQLYPEKIQLFHQRGHINTNIDDLLKAQQSFGSENHITGKIDLNLTRYLSTWNDYVDNTSRSVLRRSNLKCTYEDAVNFYLNGPLNK